MINFTNIQRTVTAAVGPATWAGQGTASYAAAQVSTSAQATA